LIFDEAVCYDLKHKREALLPLFTVSVGGRYLTQPH